MMGLSALQRTTQAQIKAASPTRSAWVGANAGSGKTRVLTNRVARLLLAGANPSRILCITYTKAAAAEMSARLFTLLGEWALKDNESLARELQKLEGEGAPLRSGEALSRARSLFARALETPGGLKIQTIHAFCSHVLKRFPLEAGVPPGFGEIEESEASILLETALDTVVREGQTDLSIQARLMYLGKRFRAGRITGLLQSFIQQRQQFERVLKGYGSIDAIIAQLRKNFDLTDRSSHESAIAGFFEHFSDASMREAVISLDVGGVNARKSAAILRHAASINDPAARFDALQLFFLTTTHSPRARLTDKAVQKADLTLDGRLTTLQDYYCSAWDQLKKLEIIEDTESFLHVAMRVYDHYEKMKWTRSVLDFDDLIIRTQHLFSHSEHAAQWVLYKLDHGLDHILVDEAQDTSPGQWDVIEKPLEEFFAGDSARDEHRTMFVVGDEKQSIYSFQGADASLFGEKKVSLGKKVSAIAEYADIPLTLSFRSTRAVLNFVDAAFHDASSMEGLGDTLPLHHEIHRTYDQGRVEIWPITPKEEKPESNPWDAPVDMPPANNPTVQLCNHIATTLQQWIGKKELLSQKRPIEAGDIIILVQSRDGLFRQILKSLAANRVPVAGADRLSLLSDIAIQDLLSLGRFCVFHEDDLSLAEVLKSPLFSFVDEDLFALCHGRKPGASLWKNLKDRCNEQTHWRTAFDVLEGAIKIAHQKGTYDFYAHILDGRAFVESDQKIKSGRERFFHRLGLASRDALDAFLQQILDYENLNPRNLQGFLSWFEANAVTIKREMDQTNNAVRVMTVHGAKGLEGKIVFLLDAHKKPTIKNLGPLYYCEPQEGDWLDEAQAFAVPALVKDKQSHVSVTNSAYEEAKRLAYEEYRRLFYVAATRAEDELYICGVQTRNTTATSNPQKEEPAYNDKSWYELALQGIEHLKSVEAREDRLTLSCVKEVPWEGAGWRFESLPDGEKPRSTEQKLQEVPKQYTIPRWLHERVTRELPATRLSPSTLADTIEGQESLSIGVQNQSQGYSPTHHRDGALRGRTIHRLLELLPDVAFERQRESAEQLLQRLVPDIEDCVRAAWCDEVMTVLHDEDFGVVFAPGSRAEVSIAGTPPGAKRDIVIHGQIDRLAICEDSVLIVDYKTNQPPPQRQEEVADAYIIQMAAYRALVQELYPGRKIKAALLWTYQAKLMALSDNLLDQAFVRFL